MMSNGIEPSSDGRVPRIYKHLLKVYDTHIVSSSGVMYMVMDYMDEDGEFVKEKAQASFITAWASEEGWLTVNLNSYNEIVLNG
jgi:hypothetical protein